MKKKRYFYCLSYVGQNDQGEESYECIYVGSKVKDKISIEDLRSSNTLKDAVLSGVYYLGYLTEEEFLAERRRKTYDV